MLAVKGEHRLPLRSIQVSRRGLVHFERHELFDQRMTSQRVDARARCGVEQTATTPRTHERRRQVAGGIKRSRVPRQSSDRLAKPAPEASRSAFADASFATCHMEGGAQSSEARYSFPWREPLRSHHERDVVSISNEILVEDRDRGAIDGPRSQQR